MSEALEKIEKVRKVRFFFIAPTVNTLYIEELRTKYKTDPC